MDDVCWHQRGRSPRKASASVLLPDSVFSFGGQQQLISTWGMRGAFNHNWNPYWSTSVYGAYAACSATDRHSDSRFRGEHRLRQLWHAAYAGVTTCNPNYSVSQAGIVTRWTPVKNLTFSGEFT